MGGLSELLRVLRVLPSVEALRLTRGPRGAVETLRSRGSALAPVSEDRKPRLRRAIRLVDALMPGGGNCYRRVLLETRLDPGAAGRQILMGLVVGGGPRSGHAWFAGDGEPPRTTYDAVISV
jgi:hypothetical protein